MSKPRGALSIVKEAAEIYGWDGLREKLGVSRQCIWFWQTGKRMPGSDVVMRCLHLISLSEKKKSASTKCEKNTPEQLEQNGQDFGKIFSELLEGIVEKGCV